MSRESIKGNTREVIRAHNFEKSLEYKANKTSNHAPLSEKEYGKELYELGKWSRTTSKQVTQIFNMADFESYNNYGFSKLHERYLCK